MCHGQMLGDALLKARRDHRTRCEFCRKPIRKGQEYREAVSRDSDGFNRWKAHLVCDAMAGEAFRANYDGCSHDPRGEALEILRYSGFSAFKARIREAVKGMRERLAGRTSR